VCHQSKTAWTIITEVKNMYGKKKSKNKKKKKPKAKKRKY